MYDSSDAVILCRKSGIVHDFKNATCRQFYSYKLLFCLCNDKMAVCVGNAKITGNVLGKRLQRARTEKSFGQAELAAELSIALDVEFSAQMVSKMERGLRAVRDKELQVLCTVLGVSSDWLLGLS